MKNQIPVIVQNNTGLKQKVTLFDRNSPYAPGSGATTQYAWNVTGLATFGPRVCIVQKLFTDAGYTPVSAPVATATLAGVVDGLNSLGMGEFHTYTLGGQTFLSVLSSTRVFGSVSLAQTTSFSTTSAGVYIYLDAPGASLVQPWVMGVSDGTAVFNDGAANGSYYNHAFGSAAARTTWMEFTVIAQIKKFRLASAVITDIGTGLAALTACTDLVLNQVSLTAFPSTYPPALQLLNLQGNAITAYTQGTLPVATLNNLDLDGNSLTTAAVNKILQDLAGGTVSNGTVKLRQAVAAPPSSGGGGTQAKAILQTRGWTVLND